MDAGKERKSGARGRGAPPYAVLENVAWGRVATGFGLAIAAGADFGCAWAGGQTLLWWLGAAALVAGSVLMILGVYASRRPADMLLGALLVYKYQAVTEEQLEQALAEQGHQRGKKRRLGQILVDLGYLTQSQLSEALAYQRSYLQSKPAYEGAAPDAASGGQ